MRSGSSSSSSRFKIRPKQVNASTCDFDRCCLQFGDNTGTHLHVSRKAICRPKQQLPVSTYPFGCERRLGWRQGKRGRRRTGASALNRVPYSAEKRPLKVSKVTSRSQQE